MGNWETRDSKKPVRQRVRNRNVGSWCIHRVDMGTRPQEVNKIQLRKTQDLRITGGPGLALMKKTKTLV